MCQKGDSCKFAHVEDSLIDVDIDMMASQRQSKAMGRLSEELQKVVASIDKKLLGKRLTMPVIDIANMF